MEDACVPLPGLEGLAADELVELVAAGAAQMATLRAGQLATVAALVARLRTDGADRFAVVDITAAHLAARLRIPVGTASVMVLHAIALTTRLPLTLTALAEGRIDDARAMAVSGGTMSLDDDAAGVVEEQVAGEMEDLTAGKLKQRVKEEVESIDPEAVQRRARRATAERSVGLYPLPDGMAELVARGPVTDLASVYEKLTAMARDRTRPGGRADPHARVVRGDGEGLALVDQDGCAVDRRGMDARRFDSLVERVRQPVAAVPGLGDGCGPQILVTFPAAVGASGEPAQLSSYGAVPGVLVRELLQDHRFRRVLTDPFTGHLVAVDGHTYPPGTLPQVGPALPPDEPPPSGPPPSAPPGGGSDGPRGSDPAPPDRPARSAEAARRRPDELLPVPAPPPLLARGAAPAPDSQAPPPLCPTDGQRPHDEPPHDARHDDTQQGPELAPAPCPVAAAGGGDYEVPVRLQRFVRLRSPRCTAPGCRVPAWRSDTDHRIPWPEGPTCPCNLAPLCRRHHLAKHRFGWHVTKAGPHPADPSQRWRSPLGHEYVVPAQPLVPRTSAGRVLAERWARAGRGGSTERRPGPESPARYPAGDRHAHDLSRVRADASREGASAADRAATTALARRRPLSADDPPPF